MLKGRSFLVKMVKDDHAGHAEEVDLTDELKSHFERNKTAYVSGGMLALAGITCFIMRGSSAGIQGVPESGIRGVPDGLTKVTVTPLSLFSNRMSTAVTVIASNRQGPPSWVVRCIETGDIFTSQRSAAAEMGIKESMLSRHLNGLLEHADGNHFERVCMAA